MSESTAVALSPPPSPAASETKRPQSDALLADVFQLMGYPVKLEFKDMPDGSLGVACHFDGELPGITPGKRSYLLDSVQFWLNKVVNRPGTPRRWVNLGLNAFPEPRQQQQPQPQLKEAPPPADAAPAPAAPAKSERHEKGDKKKPDEKKKDAPAGKKPQDAKPSQQRGERVDERTLTPAADPALAAVAKALAEKSAKLGRLYAVMGLTAEQRALMLKAAEGLKGVSAKAEGEGHWRRLVMVPEKLTPIARKQVMPDYDEGDEDE